MTEAEIQKDIITRLYNRGWVAIRFNSGTSKTATGNFLRSYWIAGMDAQPSAGFPDVIAFKENLYLLLEVKTDKGKLSLPQKRLHEVAKRRGVVIHVVRSWADVEALLNEIETYNFGWKNDSSSRISTIGNQ